MTYLIVNAPYTHHTELGNLAGLRKLWSWAWRLNIRQVSGKEPYNRLWPANSTQSLLLLGLQSIGKNIQKPRGKVLAQLPSDMLTDRLHNLFLPSFRYSFILEKARLPGAENCYHQCQWIRPCYGDAALALPDAAASWPKSRHTMLEVVGSLESASRRIKFLRRGIYGNFGVQFLGKVTGASATAIFAAPRFSGFGVKSRVFTWRLRLW